MVWPLLAYSDLNFQRTDRVVLSWVQRIRGLCMDSWSEATCHAAMVTLLPAVAVAVAAGRWSPVVYRYESRVLEG